MKKQHLVYSFIFLFSASLHASPNKITALASRALQAALTFQQNSNDLADALTSLSSDLEATLDQADQTIAHVPGFKQATDSIEKKMVTLESSLAQGKSEAQIAQQISGIHDSLFELESAVKLEIAGEKVLYLGLNVVGELPKEHFGLLLKPEGRNIKDGRGATDLDTVDSIIIAQEFDIITANGIYECKRTDNLTKYSKSFWKQRMLTKYTGYMNGIEESDRTLIEGQEVKFCTKARTDNAKQEDRMQRVIRSQRASVLSPRSYTQAIDAIRSPTKESMRKKMQSMRNFPSISTLFARGSSSGLKNIINIAQEEGISPQTVQVDYDGDSDSDTLKEFMSKFSVQEEDFESSDALCRPQSFTFKLEKKHP